MQTQKRRAAPQRLLSQLDIESFQITYIICKASKKRHDFAISILAPKFNTAYVILLNLYNIIKKRKSNFVTLRQHTHTHKLHFLNKIKLKLQSRT